jgi:hypothetical protein
MYLSNSHIVRCAGKTLRQNATTVNQIEKYDKINQFERNSYLYIKAQKGHLFRPSLGGAET